MHEKFNYYEIAVLLIPGFLAVGLYAVVFHGVTLDALMQISLGGFFTISVAAFLFGVALSVAGKAMVAPYHWLTGGQPSEWPANGRPGYMAEEDYATLKGRLHPNDSKGAWRSLFHRATLRARSGQLGGRVERLLAHYGLMRSVVALAAIALAVQFATASLREPLPIAATAAVLLLAGVAMHRAGIHYAHDIYQQELLAMEPSSDERGG